MNELFSVSEPPFTYEKKLQSLGYSAIAGIDEVGRGALAGPVVAAAVILKPSAQELVGRVKDSKKLTPEEREEIFPLIQLHALSFGIGAVDSSEIDRINILQATLKAMRLAIEQLSPQPHLCLVDGNQKIPMSIPQKTIVKGDHRVFSIAAASILAKVTRDRWMVESAARYPVYRFHEHKGYGTEVHRQAIEQFGMCDLHRKSFTLRS